MANIFASLLRRIEGAAVVRGLENLAIDRIHSLLLHEDPAFAAFVGQLTPAVIVSKLDAAADVLQGHLPDSYTGQLFGHHFTVPVATVLTPDVLHFLIAYVVLNQADQLPRARAAMTAAYQAAIDKSGK